MKKIIWILLLSFMSLFCYGQIQYGEFQYDGYTRDYIVFLPENFEPNSPLVLNLHGYELDADFNNQYLNMNGVADTAGFLVVYPNAINGIWNSGIGDSPDWPAPEVDDVAFISALIDTIYSQYQIDLGRVHSCGFSNGGFMSFRLATELSSRIHSIASVVGVMTPTIASYADTSSSIPIMIMLGTSDPVVPFDGGVEGWYSGSETIQYWITHHGLDSEVDSIILPNLDMQDGSEVTVFPYGNDLDQAGVLVYRIEGGGHKWPGGVYYSELGSMNFDISASEEIWKFFVNDRYENGNVWLSNLRSDTLIYTPAVDTIIIGGDITNMNSIDYSVFAHVINESSATIDSLQLFDDGLHHDDEPGDGFAANIILAPDTESFWSIQVSSMDVNNNRYLGLYGYTTFTTHAGLSSSNVRQVYPNQGVIEPRSTVYFYFSLQNHNELNSISDIRARIVPVDSSSEWVSGSQYASFPVIGAGEIIECLNYVGLRIADGVEDGTPILFNIEILNEGVVYWVETEVLLGTVGLEDSVDLLPISFSLKQNFPNPFNPMTTISYSLPEQSTISLTVYDVRGQEITTLQNEVKPPGNYKAQWDGTNQSGGSVSTGVYFCRLQSGSFSQTIKMVYLR